MGKNPIWVILSLIALIAAVSAVVFAIMKKTRLLDEEKEEIIYADGEFDFDKCDCDDCDECDFDCENEDDFEPDVEVELEVLDEETSDEE